MNMKPNVHPPSVAGPLGKPGLRASFAPLGSWPEPTLDRRTLIVGGSLAAAGLLAYSVLGKSRGSSASVFVARGQRYDGGLVRTIRDGLLAAGLQPAPLRGKRVLLKPNLVEPTRAAPHMTTHPAIIIATAEVFRSWGAQVAVGEGPGHVRDTDMALIESGVREALELVNLPFVDLNFDDVGWAENVGQASPLPGFFFPRSVLEADLIVSLPKMKTHHWVGVTGAMKNMYGVIPGIKYGWPKNVLHHAGIPQSVFDINASLPRTIAIMDGIDCMEGDGPILGTLKTMGLILISTSPTALDATACRIMGVDPTQVEYLQLAAERLGPLRDSQIVQRGESWRPLASPFTMLDKPHLRKLRARPGVLTS